MNKLYRNTMAKIALAALVSVMATISLFLGSMAFILAPLGLFDKPLDEYEKALVQPELNKTAYSIMNYCFHENADDNGTYKMVFDKDFDPEDHPGYDLRISMNGKKLVDTYDEDEFYIYTGQGISHYSGQKIVVNTYLKSGELDSSISSRVALADITYKYRTAIVPTSVILLILSIIGFALLMIGAGKRQEDDEIHYRLIDKLPWEISFLTMFIVCLIAFSSISTLVYSYDNLVGTSIICCLVSIALSMLLLGWLMSMAVQFKTKLFFKRSIIITVSKLLYKGVKKLPMILLVALPTAFILFIKIILTGAWAFDGILLFIEILFAIVAFAFVCYFAIVFKMTHKGAEKILSGNTDYKINTKYMFGTMKQHAKALNTINKAVDVATAERMKSERMKTELITNVSHDIKTPLTSIINYTDLLAAENLDNQAAAEYIDGISRNALRLKKLTSDIVELSKASTGNIPVNLSSCTLGILLNQALGEYEEQMAELNLKPLLKMPENDIHVKADGQLTWRIFDNLFNNICKYAQPGTRVYIDLRCEDDVVYVDFKNTSAAQLNISASELMERFVRGDLSRNTDGSGLGLSIADNLARIQGGKLDLTVDGDLFKATVKFNAWDDNPYHSSAS